MKILSSHCFKISFFLLHNYYVYPCWQIKTKIRVKIAKILINQPIIFLIEFLSNNEQYVYIYTQDVPKMSRHP